MPFQTLEIREIKLSHIRSPFFILWPPGHIYYRPLSCSAFNTTEQNGMFRMCSILHFRNTRFMCSCLCIMSELGAILGVTKAGWHIGRCL